MTAPEAIRTKHAFDALAKRAALAVCAADARYDCAADISSVAQAFSRLIADRRFLPQFLLKRSEPGRRLLVECRAPLEDGQEERPSQNVLQMPGRDGVYFPALLERGNAVPGAGFVGLPPLEGRQPLLPCEGAALGSVNLAAHLDAAGTLDRSALGRSVRMAVHFLDNVIDTTEYPSGRQSRLTRATRRIGVGFMGLAEALRGAGLSYDSPAGRDFAAGIAELIQEEARAASRRLAQLRGPFPLFLESVYHGGAARRNSAVTALFPTECLAALCGVTPGALPGSDQPVWAEACIGMQAALQAYTDGTVYLPTAFESREEMQRLCALAYTLGCKSVEVLADRAPCTWECGQETGPDGASENPEDAAQPPSGTQTPAPEPDGIRFCPNCGGPAQLREGILSCPNCGPLALPPHWQELQK